MKNNKILVISVCVILAALVVVGVVLGITKLSKGNKNPADSVIGFIEALKNIEVENAAAYTTDGKTDSFDLGTDSEKDIEMIKLFFKNLQYSVKDTTKEKDTAVVTLEISNKNLQSILNMYAAKATEIALSKLGENPDATQEDMETELLNYFKTLFDSEEVETVTTTVDVNLNKVDNEWKVVVNEALRDAMLPGMNSLTQNTDQAQ